MTGVWLADLVLLLHVLFVAALLGGYAAIAAGLLAKRPWARNVWLRGLHLAAALFIGARVWFGIACPLTEVELTLRGASPAPRWADSVLFREVEARRFSVGVTAFVALVCVTFVAAPPQRVSAERAAE